MPMLAWYLYDKHQAELENGDSNNNNNNESPVVVKVSEENRLLMSHSSSCDFSYGSSCPTPPYNNSENGDASSIRFQVVVWYVGPVDVVLGRVEMQFRITIFWNAPYSAAKPPNGAAPTVIAPPQGAPTDAYGTHQNPYQKKVWTMHGRQRAYERELSDFLDGSRLVYVPPVSVLNAVDLEILGDPEICLVDEEQHLYKWSCLYKASMLQEDLRVADFPHDEHHLSIKLGILKHRQPRKRWDKRLWKLDLATFEDTQGSIRVPHGLIVDHVRVPGFSYPKEDSLKFEFIPLDHGSESDRDDVDRCLEVKLLVRRDSSYYDKNIIPLLSMLNLVGVSTLSLDASKFGARGEMLLATAFVEIGIRMTVDSRLPIVGYQIKMQAILNSFFLGLLFLVVESSGVYLLAESQRFGNLAVWCDRMAALVEVSHVVYLLLFYYRRGTKPLEAPKLPQKDDETVNTIEETV